MEPAKTIIAKLGGPRKVAAIAGVHRLTVHKWKTPKDKGGTGGIIPARHMRPLLDAARAEGKDVCADSFVPSGEHAA